MGIYLPNMEMPKTGKPIMLYLTSEGKVFVGVIGELTFTLYKAHERSIPCNSCAFLVKKGGPWEYTCHRGGAWHFDDTFDTPPKYCKYYKPMEDQNDA